MAAEQGGAARVELCDNLLEGGTTPSAGMIAVTRERITISLHVLIRPRGGDFCYTDLECEVMKRDIALARQLGADGVVIGVLCPDGTVDVKRTSDLIAAARPLKVTFHRAFDVTRNANEALETLIRLGVDRVLTSGQEPTVLAGAGTIASLIETAASRIGVMPGGGITEENAQRIIATTGATEIHVRGTSLCASPMQHRNQRVSFRKAFTSDEHLRTVTDAERIRRIVNLFA